ncbi:hypothetical protein PMAYCL1PPCAC_05780, partial [Pristionchus mayeri]
NLAFPTIHTVIFAIGVFSNVGLLLASFFRTPQTLKTYSIMFKFGTLNDLISVCCDFFTMQRLMVLPGNLLYLSLGPCSLISPRSCFLAYCMQLCSLLYSMYVMTVSFAYRLWILHRPSPTNRDVVVFMVGLYFPPALVAGLFTFAQADDQIVRDFLQKNAPYYLSEAGALTGHSGMTPHLIFTIVFIIMIISKLREHATGMSERTRKMHSNLIEALTVHAMLPPITVLAVAVYIVLFFEVYRHAFAAIPPAFGALCTIYYVEPYRQFVLCRSRVSSTFTPSTASV